MDTTESYRSLVQSDHNTQKQTVISWSSTTKGKYKRKKKLKLERSEPVNQVPFPHVPSKKRSSRAPQLKVQEPVKAKPASEVRREVS